VATARQLPAEFFAIASEVASMDQQIADAHAEWENEKAMLRQRVKDAGARV